MPLAEGREPWTRRRAFGRWAAARLLSWTLAGGAATAMLPVGAAHGEELGSDRFYAERPETRAEEEETGFDASLTSTTFYYTEFGKAGEPYGGFGAAPVQASPLDRLFTDLRAQVDLEHIKGGDFDVRIDVRGRLTQSHTVADDHTMNDPPTVVRTQSGMFGRNELDLRELYARRNGESFDVTVGRQFALELGAVKFDGVKLERGEGERWKLIGFAGAYPMRGSRTVGTDYPVDRDNDPVTDGAQPKRIVPLTAGLGTGYRFEKAYGAFGAVAIAPLANDRATGTTEKTRAFVTSSGYFRPSATLDLYHYLELDAAGAAGAGLTNATVGVAWQPTLRLRTSLQLSHIDTETLNVQAQTRLEDPDSEPGASTALQNNIAVSRISQDSIRGGVSAAFRQERFQVSASGTWRRRPEVTVLGNNDTEVVFPSAKAADITLSFVDRRSFGGFRLGGSVTRTFGLGDTHLYRSKALILRADASRPILDGDAEIEGNLTYVSSQDDNIGTTCTPSDIVTCFGGSQVSSVSAGGLMFYRFTPTWFVIGSLSFGRESLTVTTMADTVSGQPPIWNTSMFLRAAHRF